MAVPFLSTHLGTGQARQQSYCRQQVARGGGHDAAPSALTRFQLKGCLSCTQAGLDFISKRTGEAELLCLLM